MQFCHLSPQVGSYFYDRNSVTCTSDYQDPKKIQRRGSTERALQHSVTFSNLEKSKRIVRYARYRGVLILGLYPHVTYLGLCPWNNSDSTLYLMMSETNSEKKYVVNVFWVKISMLCFNLKLYPFVWSVSPISPITLVQPKEDSWESVPDICWPEHDCYVQKGVSTKVDLKIWSSTNLTPLTPLSVSP